MKRTTIAFAALTLLLMAMPASGQTEPPEPGGPDPARVRLRLGPVYLNPTLSLTNAGRDNNVFNEPDQLEPKSDFTMTVTPATDVWLRIGRSWLRANLREDIVWYQTYTSERSSNESYDVNWTVPLNRIVAAGGATYVDAKDRPGFEIDARAQRTDLLYYGSAEVRAFSKTFIGVRGSHRTVNFDANSLFLGVSLQESLSRTETSASVTVRHQLTPLTAITVAASREEDRFENTPLRDADSTFVTFNVSFDPFALLKGSATVGYRDFALSSGGVPGYRGTMANVNLAYAPTEATRLSAQVARDVQYSFELAAPYYLQTGVSGSVTQQVFGPVDAVVRGGLQRLHYTEDARLLNALLQRVDRVWQYGAGIGYHFGQDLRLGFNVDNSRRQSIVSVREYNGLRFGFSLTYGS
jgi:hypothetical protein